MGHKNMVINCPKVSYSELMLEADRNKEAGS